jgi:hypothetical protein
MSDEFDTYKKMIEEHVRNIFSPTEFCPQNKNFNYDNLMNFTHLNTNNNNNRNEYDFALNFQHLSTTDSDIYSDSSVGGSGGDQNQNISNNINLIMTSTKIDNYSFNLVDTPPFSPDPTFNNHNTQQPPPVINLNNLDTPFVQRPNRPYSYYFATNFNPLDLSNNESLSNDKTFKEELDEEWVDEKQKKKEQFSSSNNKNSAKNNGKKGESKKKLSISMSDIQAKINTETKMSSTTSTTPTANSNSYKSFNMTLKNLKSKSQHYFGSLTNNHKNKNSNTKNDFSADLSSISKLDKDQDHYKSSNLELVYENQYDVDGAFETITNNTITKNNQTMLNKSLHQPFKRLTKLSSTMPIKLSNHHKSSNKTSESIHSNTLMNNNNNNSNTKSEHPKSMNKLNKFFRTLFKKPQNEMPSSPSNKNKAQTHIYESSEKINRTNAESEIKNNIKYKYNVTTGLTAARLQSTSTTASTMTNASSSNSNTQSKSQSLVVRDDEQQSQQQQQQNNFIVEPMFLPKINLDSLNSDLCNENTLVTNDMSCVISPSIYAESSLSPSLEHQSNKIIKNEVWKNFEYFKANFYVELDERLKKLSTSNDNNNHQSPSLLSMGYFTLSGVSSRNEKSSLSSIDSIDIPYIDDDDAEEQQDDCEADNGEVEHDTKLERLNTMSNSVHSSGRSSSNGSHDTSHFLSIDKLIELCADDTSLEKFSEIAEFYSIKCDSISEKLEKLFEITCKAIYSINTTNQKCVKCIQIEKLKESAAHYTHKKYLDWILEHGGWV